MVGDAETYHLLARVLAAGDGYVRPRELLELGRSVPTAEFPPLHPFVLALADLVGIDSPNGQRVVGACLGVVTVGLIGLLARRIAGDRAGLVAAGLAALSPVLIEHDTSLQAEGLFALLADGVAARHPRRHDPADHDPLHLVLLGLLLGAAALTRSEALLLVPVAAVLVGLAAGAHRPGGRWRGPSASWRRARWCVTGVVGGAQQPSPSTRVVLTSTNAGTLAGRRNCDPVYGGEQKGLWRLDCVPGRRHHATSSSTRSARTRRWTSAGAGATPPTTPRRCPAWPPSACCGPGGCGTPSGQIGWETFEGRDRYLHRFAHRIHVVMLVLAVARLRGAPPPPPRAWSLLLTPVVASVLVSAALGRATPATAPGPTRC